MNVFTVRNTFLRMNRPRNDESHTRNTGTNTFVNALVNLRFPCFFNSFLHSAVRSGSEKAVELLLKYNADVEARDVDLRTPLHISVLAGDANLHISDILLAHVWQSGKTETTPPWILSSCAATSNGLSVLDVARTASCENENTIQWLLSNGAQSALKQEQEKETSMTLNMKTSSSSSSSKSTTVEEEKMNDPIFQYYFSKEMSRLDADRDLKPEELEMMFDIPDSIALSVVDSDRSSSGVVSNQQQPHLSNDDEGKIYDFESHTFKSEENSPAKTVSSTKKKTKISPSSGLKSRHWISDSTAIRAKLMRNVRRKRLEEVKTNS